MNVLRLFYTYSLKNTSKYFPNLDELSFRVVLAFPNDSKRGFASKICSVMVLLGARFTYQVNANRLYDSSMVSTIRQLISTYGSQILHNKLG